MLSRRYYAQDASTSLLLAVDKSTILGRFIRLALDSYTYVRICSTYGRRTSAIKMNGEDTPSGGCLYVRVFNESVLIIVYRQQFRDSRYRHRSLQVFSGQCVKLGPSRSSISRSWHPSTADATGLCEVLANVVRTKSQRKDLGTNGHTSY